jgi:hypothetical protein
VTYDFTNTSQAEKACKQHASAPLLQNVPSGSSLHHHLALTLTKGVGELRLVVLVDEVIEIWLATELVNSLSDLVASSIPKTREQRHHLGQDRLRRSIPEDDGRQRR